MDLTFLSARIPLTKTISYNARDNAYHTAPYPMVSRVTSYHEQADTLRDFAALLKKHGAQGHCLLKGHLDQTLTNASRAGHAVEGPHEWVVFDFDKVDCAPSFDGAVAAIGKYLPSDVRQADAIVQLSTSCYNPETTQLSCHVFMRLSTPVDTATLKAWLEWINFNSPLKDELKLTDSQIGLHFPLDRTVASPSKLVYIAPPKIVGFKNPIGDSIRFFAGKTRSVAVPTFTPIAPEQMQDKINELRKRAGLGEREYRTITKAGRDILIKAEECAIHDIQKSGDSYLRFNLNGGDSLAYYINLREPHIIGNHKGEPAMYTREAAPELFKALTKAAKSLPLGQRMSETVEPLAFYATNRGSAVYIGHYDRATDELRVDPSSETAAKSWQLSFGLLPTTLPHLDIVTDMTSEVRYEPGYPIVNLYRQTDLMKEYSNPPTRELEDLKEFGKHCPVLWKTILSVLGDSVEAAEHFIHWLAHIFQTRERTNTAWVWHGVQGTGKGMLMENLMRPLFGESVVKQVTYSLIDTKFNAFMDGTLILNVDEADLSMSLDKADVRAKLYNWIAEPTIMINEKRQTERPVPNHCNMIFTTNSIKPVQIEQGDRRFNVGEHQANRLIYTPNEFAIITSGEELPAFAERLGQWKVDQQRLLKPYGGEAKERMYEATHSLPERIARAIREGDTLFFIESRPTQLQIQSDLIGKPLPIGPYDQLLRDMVDQKLNVLRREDLYVLMRVVIGHNERLFPDNNAEQRRVLQKIGLLPGRKEAHRDKRTDKITNGIKVGPWDRSTPVENAMEELFDTTVQSKVTSIHRGK